MRARRALRGRGLTSFYRRGGLPSPLGERVERAAPALYALSWRDTPPGALLAQLLCLGPRGLHMLEAASSVAELHLVGGRASAYGLRKEGVREG